MKQHEITSDRVACGCEVAAPQPALADRHLCEGPKRARCLWSIHCSVQKRLNQCEYLRVHRTQMDKHDWACILSFCLFYTAHSLNMSKFCIDQHWSYSWASHPPQDISSRRLKTSQGICHAFWEQNQNVDQTWLRFEGLLLDPDWLVAATVLSRRLCLFGGLTLGISQCSPEALPDPILPDVEVFDLSVHDYGQMEFLNENF